LTRYKNGKEKSQTTLCDQILYETETECCRNIRKN